MNANKANLQPDTDMNCVMCFIGTVNDLHCNTVWVFLYEGLVSFGSIGQIPFLNSNIKYSIVKHNYVRYIPGIFSVTIFVC